MTQRSSPASRLRRGRHRTVPLTAPTALGAALVAVAAAALRLTDGLRHPVQPAYDDLLVAGAAWLLALCAGWSVLLCGAAAVEAASAGRVPATRWVGCPPSVRRVLLAGLGVVLAGGATGLGAPAVAATVPPGPGGAPPGDRDRSTLPVPARPTGAANGPVTPVAGRVRVRPGDSLWRLVEHRAPRLRTPQVARVVAQTYRANRRVIGPDPDLIQPGQRLVIPRPQPHHHPRPQEMP